MKQQFKILKRQGKGKSNNKIEIYKFTQIMKNNF